MQSLKSQSSGGITRLGDRLRSGHQVRCVDCGYLTQVDLSSLWGRLQQGQAAPSEDAHGREIFLTEREKIRFRRFKNAAGLTCFRHVELYESEPDEPLRRDELEKRIFDGVVMPRSCAYFRTYVPGLPPQDHLLLEHQRTAPAPELPVRDPDYWVMVASLCLASFFLGLITRPLWEGLVAMLFGLR